MKKILNLLVSILAVMVIMTACEDEEKSVNQEGLNPNDGKTGLSFDGIDQTSKVYSFKSGHISLIDFDDLTNPVMSNHYASMGVYMYSSDDGVLEVSYSPCNASKALNTNPFTGPFIWFNFDLPIWSCSIEAGDLGPSDSDVMTLTAYSDLNGNGTNLGSVTQTLTLGHETGCLTLALASLNGARSVVITSVGDYYGTPYPNSIFVDNLLFERTIEVDIDIKPGSSPNSLKCSNGNHIIAVAILSTELFDATSVDHNTVKLDEAMEWHKKGSEPERHEEDVNEDGLTDLVFHFRLSETSLDCNSTEGTITGLTFNGEHIIGFDEVTMR